MSQQIRLRVAEAKQRDAGRMKARINDDAMQALHLKAKDIIAIEGQRLTAGIVWPAYADDQRKSIIRLDGLIRKNAGVKINEYVTIKKAAVNNATSMTLTPIDTHLNVDQELRNWVKTASNDSRW
jgi:transitional endoplasmic reticulum ATPase